MEVKKSGGKKKMGVKIYINSLNTVPPDTVPPDTVPPDTVTPNTVTPNTVSPNRRFNFFWTYT